MTAAATAVLYHSGSGSTKLVSTVIAERLEESGPVDLVPISFECDTDRVLSYRTLVFGFPTYHGNPSRSMREFFDRLPVADDPIPVHLFITYGLYPDHTLRVAALMLPEWIGMMFRYEKRAPEKIDGFVSGVWESMNNGVGVLRMPRYVWYTSLNAPHRLLGEMNNDRCKNRMRVDEHLCTSCGRCVRECIRGCWRMENDAPVFHKENCEFCVRCIHNCPAGAITFSGGSREKPLLNGKFYDALKPTLLHGGDS